MVDSRRLKMNNDTVVKINGLFPDKGQRLEDLLVVNPKMSKDILEKSLQGYINEGKVETYTSNKVKHYLLSV